MAEPRPSSFVEDVSADFAFWLHDARAPSADSVRVGIETVFYGEDRAPLIERAHLAVRRVLLDSSVWPGCVLARVRAELHRVPAFSSHSRLMGECRVWLELELVPRAVDLYGGYMPVAAVTRATSDGAPISSALWSLLRTAFWIDKEATTRASKMASAADGRAVTTLTLSRATLDDAVADQQYALVVALAMLADAFAMPSIAETSAERAGAILSGVHDVETLVDGELLRVLCAHTPVCTHARVTVTHGGQYAARPGPSARCDVCGRFVEGTHRAVPFTWSPY